jgi:hypothetical protein
MTCPPCHYYEPGGSERDEELTESGEKERFLLKPRESILKRFVPLFSVSILNTEESRAITWEVRDRLYSLHNISINKKKVIRRDLPKDPSLICKERSM